MFYGDLKIDEYIRQKYRDDLLKKQNKLLEEQNYLLNKQSDSKECSISSMINYEEELKELKRETKIKKNIKKSLLKLNKQERIDLVYKIKLTYLKEWNYNTSKLSVKFFKPLCNFILLDFINGKFDNIHDMDYFNKYHNLGLFANVGKKKEKLLDYEDVENEDVDEYQQMIDELDEEFDKEYEKNMFCDFQFQTTIEFLTNLVYEIDTEGSVSSLYMSKDKR